MFAWIFDLAMSSVMSAAAVASITSSVVSGYGSSVVMAVVADAVFICVREIITDSVSVRIRIAVVIADAVAVCIGKAGFTAIPFRKALTCRTSADGTDISCRKCRNRES